MFSKILKVIGEVLGYLIGVGLTVLWVVGSIHAGKKHDEALLAWIAFPWGMYRGAESFWHNDYANVDWDKRLADDTRSAIYLITESTSREGNLVELNNTTEQFSNKITNYPKDKIEYIKGATKAYISFNISGTDVLVNQMNEYFKTGQFTFQLSDSATKYKEVLIRTYKLNDVIDPLEAAMKQQANQMKTVPLDDSAEVRKLRMKFNENISIYIAKSKAEMLRVYKNIFNEEY
jgi:hypothetical protein